MKKRVLAALLAAAMVFGLVACGGSKTTETKAAETEASGEIEACTINFQYWADNTDYSALMQDIIAKFNEENEYGITVVGEEIPWDGGGYTNTLFNAAMGGGAPDVATFKLTGTPMFVNNGLLADLTGMIDAWEDKDDISENLYNVMRAAGGSDSIYVMPWNVQVLYVYYRPSIFEEAGVEVPTTYEELITLCETIVESNIPVKGSKKDAVKPFAYTGANTDYFDYTVFDWWGQIVGKEAITEFLKYENATNFDSSSNETYAALKTATSYWQKLFVSDNGTGESKYVVANSKSKTAENAQKEFVNGYAAMMFNGDWLYNEIINYGISMDNFELGLMKTPVIKEAKEEYVNTSYVIGEDQYIVIPKTSTKIDLAVEFIKLMVSNQGSCIFTEMSNGFLAYDTDFTNANITDSFIKDTIAIRESYTAKFTSYSPNRKYLCNYIDIWCTSALRPYLGLLNGTTPVDTAFSNIYTTANANWADWTSRSQ